MPPPRIVSYSDEPFNDRCQAGRLLAKELSGFCGKPAVVLGIPRGGLVIATQIAETLGASLDAVLSHKLGYPGNPELAIGAVSESGRLFLNPVFARQFKEDDAYIRQEKARQLALIKRRASQYRAVLPRVSLKDKIAIIVDDGVATGATMEAALWASRQESPAKLVCALPVGPIDTIERLSGSADELVCLRLPSYFSAIGQFYLEFAQVEDEEALGILRQEAERRKNKKEI